ALALVLACGPEVYCQNLDSSSKTDLHGDSLPKGALARVGTLRWRHEADRLLFSADGKYLASSGHEVRLWETKSGRWLRSIPSPAAFFSFPESGKTLVTAEFLKGQAVINIWDAESGKSRRRFVIPLEDFFQCAWSADGKILACIHFNIQKKDIAVAFWDMESGKEIRRWQAPATKTTPHQSPLAAKGKSLAIMDHRLVRVFDPQSGKLLRQFPASANHRTGGTPNMAFSGDGSQLICTHQEDVYLWNTTTGKELGHFTCAGKAAGVA